MQILNRALIKKYIPENAIIVEAGAHIGRDTLKLHKLLPKATIHAFEPVTHIFEQLQKAVTGIENIKTHNLALSDKTGNMKMHVAQELDTISSLLAPDAIQQEKPDVTFIEQVVKTTTLDDWAKEQNIDNVDLLWLDLQGYELPVLKASPNILKTVKAIYTEASKEPRYANHTLYPELKVWLESQGFEIVAENFHHKTWGNVLFVRSTH